jgi:TM2 domain-containing membrane protein YozV
MAQLTELLLAQAQNQQVPKTQKVEPVENYPKVTPKSKKPNKPKQPANMKTASTLSWVFPGMGHYYSGRTGKGILFTGLELTALAGVAIFSGSYSDESYRYNTDYNYWEANQDNTQVSQTDNKAAVTDAFNAKQSAMYGLIGAGSLSAVVWIWNIIDVKKSKSQSYSSSSPVSIGINSRGQVEARFSF